MASFSLSLTPPFIKSHFKGRIYYIVDWGWAQCNYDIQGYWESVLSCSQRHFVAAAVQHFPKLIFALIRCWRPKVCSARGIRPELASGDGRPGQEENGKKWVRGKWESAREMAKSQQMLLAAGWWRALDAGKMNFWCPKVSQLQRERP